MASSPISVMHCSSSPSSSCDSDDRNSPNDPVKAQSQMQMTAGTTTPPAHSRQTRTVVSHSAVRWLLDAVLVTSCLTLSSLLLMDYCHVKYLQPLVDSYKRTSSLYDGDDDDLYAMFHHEFTYYNRQCGLSDVGTTTEASDLLIHDHDTPDEAAAVMLQHGAVAFTNVLSRETATQLRAYLSHKHTVSETLGWNEKFWEAMTRLAIALGTSDDPIVTEALQQVGSQPVLKRTLEALLGPDPAIVEISTLSALRGAENQDIHSDSDYFGSSLLYARNFLHSYSFFVALQDTNKTLGATTICPGSHYCANIELDGVCFLLGKKSFEISTNGITGKDGVIKQGDAFLFNQNVWHRGSANTDESDQDRIMFILTFASRAAATPGDRRRQGLGTYYYQRWNMWSHTFNDLKHAATRMVQPFAALGALGLWKSAKQNVGILWWEQLSQQMANADDFYTSEHLQELHEKVLDHWHVPAFLRSNEQEWEYFIPDTLRLWIVFLMKVHAIVVALYAIALLVVSRWEPSTAVKMTQQQQQTKPRPSVMLRLAKRLVLTHATVGLFMYAMVRYISQTRMAKSVTSGDVFVRPFPAPPTDGQHRNKHNKIGPTTFPERNDVLIGSRFDAAFLASFNRFLDFHPGNQQWRAAVAHVAHNMPPSMQPTAIQAIVNNVLKDKQGGTYGQFLLQDYITGSWMIMPVAHALQETKHAVVREQTSILARLDTHLKYVLADARFGTTRDTVMAQQFTPLFVAYYQSVLFGEHKKQSSSSSSSLCRPSDSTNIDALINSGDKKRGWSHGPWFHLPTLRSWEKVKSVWERQTPVSSIDDDDDDAATFYLGDRVWVNDSYRRKVWSVAEIIGWIDDTNCHVSYMDGHGTGVANIDEIRKYVRLREGDKVEVDFDKVANEFYTGVITNVHPDGRCSVVYEDGDYDAAVKREYVLRA